MTIPTREEALEILDCIPSDYQQVDELKSWLRSYIESHTGESLAHEWHERFGLTCCKVCGFVRNENSDTKGCRGPVYVSLRDASPVQPDAALTEALTRIEELEGALRPFIKAAGCLHDDEPDDMPIFLRRETNIKAGDLRRAATLTQGIKE